ncbi:F-box domain-containing protein [Mycena indigotica]|uniref:F-box domain-containing protein n=1 Tax=Mycena indigotica TaxID=2126181 RepID=A0A8H6RZ33_9AGAR|nr:F-box domain-containing protein [Mycena indigotica]KAF7289328.1 F-box domain-containing protein [Mycena indigotica]
MTSTIPTILDSLDSLLNSNYALTALQKTQCQLVLHEKQHKMLDLDSEISEAKAVLAVLECRRSDLEKEHGKYKAALSPVRDLPPEILAEIFQYLTPTLPLATDLEREEVERPPFAIAIVCQSWRATALSLPKLWSTLDIKLVLDDSNFAYDSEDELDESWGCGSPFRRRPAASDEHLMDGLTIESALEWVIASISRSGNHRLSFRLHPSESTANLLLNLLFKYKHRWYRAMFIHVETFPDIPGVLNTCNLPILHEVAFSGPWGRYIHFNPSHAPNLHVLGVYGILSSLDFPLSTLTEYSQTTEPYFDESLPNMIYPRLASANLVVMRLNSMSLMDDSDTASRRRPLLFPCLRIACFYQQEIYRYVGEGRKLNLMATFDTPFLEAYSLESDSHAIPTKLEPLLPRSPHLRILRLLLPNSTKLRSHEVQSTLRMRTEIEELSLHIPARITTEFIRHMDLSEDRPMLPKLKNLYISDSSLEPEARPLDPDMADAVVHFVRGRFGAPDPLRKFCFLTHTSKYHRPEDTLDDMPTWARTQDINLDLKKMRMEKGWNITCGTEARLPRWDSLTLNDLS